jgi:hypothetical protein
MTSETYGSPAKAKTSTRPPAQDKTFLRRSEPTALGRDAHKTTSSFSTRLDSQHKRLLQRSEPTALQPWSTQDNLKISTATAFKTYWKRFQNLLPVGNMTTRRDSFRPPPFPKVLEHIRRFYPGLTRPKARSIISPLQTTRCFYREVIYLTIARTAKGGCLGIPTLRVQRPHSSPFSLP